MFLKSLGHRWSMSLRLGVLLVVVCVSLVAFAPVMLWNPLANYRCVFSGRNALLDSGQVLRIHLDSMKEGDYAYPLRGGVSAVSSADVLNVYSRSDSCVKSAFSGVVRMVCPSHIAGSFLVINHDNGLETFYRHVCRLRVRAGQRVKAGQVVASADKSRYGYAVSVTFLVSGVPIHPYYVFDTYNQRPLDDVLECRLTHGWLISSTLKRVAFQAARKKFLAGLVYSLDPVNPKYFGAAGPQKINLEFIGGTHWCYPLVGSFVTSPYDKERERQDSTGTYRHTGVDIKTKLCHDSIHVAFDGVVEEAGAEPGYGNYIIVKHAYGLETLYGHQSRNVVHVGQHVHAGQVIGFTGATGHATGDHLHFEVIYRGQRVDPALFFDHKKHVLRKATVFLRGPQLVSKPNDERGRYMFGWKLA